MRSTILVSAFIRHLIVVTVALVSATTIALLVSFPAAAQQQSAPQQQYGLETTQPTTPEATSSSPATTPGSPTEEPGGTPSITVNPTQGPPGTTVTVTGSGWVDYAGESVVIQTALVGDVPGVLDLLPARTSARPDDSGTFSVPLTIPESAPPGREVKISALLGNGGSVDASFDVTPSDLGSKGSEQTSGGPSQQQVPRDQPPIQPRNPIDQPDGGKKISDPNPGGGSSQKKGQPDPPKDGLITRFIGLLRPIVEPRQGDPQKEEQGSRGLLHTIYCTLFSNDSSCQGATNQTNPSSGGNSLRNPGGIPLQNDTGGPPDEFKQAQYAQVGCMLTFAPVVGGWAAVAYTSIVSQDPYEAAQIGTVEWLKHAEKLKDIQVVKKYGVTPRVLESVAKGAKNASIAMAIPDCITFGKDVGLIGEYSLTKDLGINKLLEMLGMSPGPSDTSRGEDVILSCNQFPGQSIDEIKKNCQEVSLYQSGPQTTDRPTFYGKDYPAKGYTP